MIRYITDIQTAPAPFDFINFTAKDLTDNLVACYTRDLSRIRNLVPDYLHTLRGCLVTPDSTLAFTPLSDHLWHITVSEPCSVDLKTLLSGFLNLISEKYVLQNEVSRLKQDNYQIQSDLNSIVSDYQKKTEETQELNKALNKNEILFRLQFELGNIGIALTSPEKGWLKVNQRLCHILGYSQEELLKMKWHEMTYPPDLNADLIQFKRMLDGEIDAYELDKRFIRKDKSLVYTHLTVSCFRNSDRSVCFVIASILDISGFKKTEEKLKDTNARLEAILSAVPDLLFEVDQHGRIYNFRCRDNLNLYVSQECFLMHRIPDVLPPEASQIILEALARAVKTGYDYGSCYSLVMKGIQKWFELSISLKQSDDSKNPHLIMLARDITERKEREEELAQKNEELTRFNYTISHDLKSPMVTLNAFIEHLENDLRLNNKEQTRHSLDFIKNASKKMTELLENLLKFSRLGHRRNSFEKTTFQAVTRDALELTAGLFQSKIIKIKKTHNDITIYGNQAQLIELYQNLIENAVKYMGNSPSPQIEIGFENRSDSVEFFVKDNGIGIEPQYREMIFNIFEKLDPQTEGSGVGLALVRRIVELHGGTIRVESEGKGKGASFLFTLKTLPP